MLDVLAVGTRVRLRAVHDFLTPPDPTGTVTGPGDGPGLVRVRFDAPVRCRLDDEAPHDLVECSELPSNLELLGHARGA